MEAHDPSAADRFVVDDFVIAKWLTTR